MTLAWEEILNQHHKWLYLAWTLRPTVGDWTDVFQEITADVNPLVYYFYISANVSSCNRDLPASNAGN